MGRARNQSREVSRPVPMVGFGVVAVGTWGYIADYYVSTAPTAAQRTVRQWIGPVKSQSVAGG